jgi:hypothetical protein
MNRRERRAMQFGTQPQQHSAHGRWQPLGHEWDEEAVCKHCSFDGAEAWHLRHSIPLEARPTKPDDFERYCSRRPMLWVEG